MILPFTSFDVRPSSVLDGIFYGGNNPAFDLGGLTFLDGAATDTANTPVLFVTPLTLTCTSATS